MTTIKTGLNTDFVGTLAAFQGRLYFVNDFDKAQVWNPPKATMDDAGIPAADYTLGAATQSAGNCDIGDHSVRARWLNSETGYVSDPTANITETVASSAKQLVFDMGSGEDVDTDDATDGKIDKVIIEMTPVGSSDFYVAAKSRTTNTSVTVNLSDAVLTTQERVEATYGKDGHSQPPLALLAAEHKGRLILGAATRRTINSASVTNGSSTITGAGFTTEWDDTRMVVVGSDTVAYEINTVTSTSNLTLDHNYTGSTDTSVTIVVQSKTPNRIFWSKAGFPESFDTTARARDVLQNTADELSAMFSYEGDLYLVGQHSMERLIYDTDPAAGSRVPMPTEHGAYNQRCIIRAEGRLFGFGRAGAWELRGGMPTHISRPVDVTLDTLIDRDQSGDFHGEYDPVERVVRWWFTETGDTRPKSALTMEVDSSEWWIDDSQKAITASKIVPDDDGNSRTMLGDVNGYLWFAGVADFDGVPSSSDSVLTVTTASGTSITVSETLPTSSNDLQGVNLYDPTADESRIIDSNTGSVITLASAFTADPSNGDSLFLGHINQVIETKWVVRPGELFIPDYLHIHLIASNATGKMSVEVYTDFSASAFQYTSLSDDDAPDGLALNTAKTAWEVDLDGGDNDGYVSIPMPAERVRSIKARITITRPDGDVQITDIRFGTMKDQGE